MAGRAPAVLNGERPADNLARFAYRQVLGALFDRRLPLGAFVSQRDLVRLLNVPVQPLRDALKVLEAEGVVEIMPRAGIQFVKPDYEMVHNIYQFRAIIERTAARRFAETADGDSIAALIDDHRRVQSTIEQAGFDDTALSDMLRLERTLHDGMTASLRNPLVEKAAQRLKNHVILIRLDVVMTRPFALRTIAEHLAILSACAERDGDRAEAALADHFQQSLGRMVGTI
ncbi:GntR family transcriptional regulator [Sphingobium algorifonticola]|uniref:GntR family transcriptional regulator n=1 Tax=Sphingobium algorifonticola TaxID=2008318 RepID=A0A437J484_9SPHN|nr:GntR family transcriptional regulator [Sphingobium algorifonticola]RVT39432.1 GntR family transcriptional regulator [Sphingobium algorifonticola]